MRLHNAALGSLAWLVAAPGVVCGLVPWLLTRWHRPADPLLLVDCLGWCLVVSASAVLLQAFAAFAWFGRGTPAPPAPTERLVIVGAYRWVRNPMYVAVLALILGQVLLFASWALLGYLVAVAVTVIAFVHVYEEPTLRAAYGPAYDEFAGAVPRWIPRLRPGRGRATAPARR